MNSRQSGDRDKYHGEERPRSLRLALLRGAAGRCPSCGAGALFEGYLTLYTACASCGIDLRRHAPAAGPAFLTVAVAGVVLTPVLWLAAAILGPDPALLILVGVVTLPILAVLLLRVIKGAMVGYLWALDVAGGAERER